MTVDELLSKAENFFLAKNREPYQHYNTIHCIAYTFLALVKMLKEIEEDGRGDDEN